MTRSSKPSTTGSGLFLATEPIVNRHARILGFQIRVGEAFGQAGAISNAHDDAVLLAGSLDPDGLTVLSRGHTAFVRVTRDGLVGAAPVTLHPGHAILEIPGSLDADKEVRAACNNLRERGYRFSIDDFSTDCPAAPLVPFASYLKFDCSDPDAAEGRARAVACFRPEVTALVGTGVHTPAQMDAAAADGLEYFQGFMLGVPRTSKGRAFNPNQIALLHLLRALGNPKLSIGALEDLVKHDPALCYRILRTVNSPAFAIRTTVLAMGQAILLLGRDTIARWATLWTMAGLGADSHDELIVMSAVRARLCETLVSSSRGEEAGREAFLLGMCSLFDAILGRPMTEIVGDLPLSSEVGDVLCGDPGPLRDVLDCVIAHERGAWTESAELAAKVGVNPRLLPGGFMEALRWARELSDTTSQIATQH